MTGQTGFLRRRITFVPVLIRGELAIGAQLRATKLHMRDFATPRSPPMLGYWLTASWMTRWA